MSGLKTASGFIIFAIIVGSVMGAIWLLGGSL